MDVFATDNSIITFIDNCENNDGAVLDFTNANIDHESQLNHCHLKLD